MPAVRLTDVAQEAGVSLATASRVLNGSARVPGKMVAEKVRLTAQKLGYVTNAQAQALSRSRSGLIGLVVHDIADPYFATIARAIQQQVFASGVQVLLTQTNRDLETEAQAIRSLIAQRVDALILMGSRRYGAESDAALLTLLERFSDGGGRVLGLGQSLGVGRTIETDDAEATHALASRLVDGGHRRFAVVEGLSGIPSTGYRAAGFHAGLAAAGIEPELRLRAGLDRAGGYDVAGRIDEHLQARGHDDDLPLCVFTSADVMALGALGELHRRGISVPDEVGIAGFGDVPGAADSNPSLTTIALPILEMARTAVEWAVPAPEGAPVDERAQTHLTCEVVLRDSSALRR